ncbi:hypothetical protein HNR44_002776 [Geomicrobium halophilum]|uniref:Uncharacterized protein n=1 Tax=Geomicrobium halophilum TaxID=549000 RepID=A0A841PUG0_9BACL|nr:hypothetical protein [Geomicrobium halophilum]
MIIYTIVVVLVLLSLLFLLLATLNIAAHVYFLKSGMPYKKILLHTFVQIAIILGIALILWSLGWFPTWEG